MQGGQGIITTLWTERAQELDAEVAPRGDVDRGKAMI